MSNSNLMNHVLMNKLDDELNKAINEVGGNTSSAKGPWDYPAIIKEQLEAKGMSADLKAGPGIVIRDFHGQKFICSTSGALTTGALNPPTGSYNQPVSEVIDAGTPVQEVFEALFYKILPKLTSLYKGDIIQSDANGSDRYNEEDTRTGLIPNSVYLRLYVANRQEPVYVLLSGHGLVNSESGLGDLPSTPGVGSNYVGADSEFISVSVNGNVITASLNSKGVEMFNKISAIESNLSQIDRTIKDLESNNDNVTDSIREINSKLYSIENNISTFESALNGKASVSELNIINSTVNSLTSQVNNFASQLNAIDVKVSSKADAALVEELRTSVNTLTTTVNALDKYSTQVDKLLVDVDSINRNVNSLSEELDQKADLVALDNLSESVEIAKADIIKKADASEVASISQTVESMNQTVSEVQQIVVEVQQTAVTQEQVNRVVEQEVTNVVNNTEVIDGKVEEKIIDALNSDEDNDIKTAIGNVVSDAILNNVDDSTTEMVDDLFANI